MRVAPIAWTVAIGGPALLLAFGAAADFLVSGHAPRPSDFLRVAEYPMFGPATLVLAEIIFYGFGEEIGWRGFLLPRLERRFGAVAASPIVSLFWAGWHLPLIPSNPTSAGFGAILLLAWFLSIVAGSFLTT